MIAPRHGRWLAWIRVVAAASAPALFASALFASVLCANQDSQSQPQHPPLVVAPPPEEIVKAIHVLGAKRYSEARLIDALGQKIGEPLDRTQVDRGIKTLWQSFHVRANTSKRAVEGGVELQLTVEELPSDLEPRFIGNDGIDEKTIKQWAGLDQSTEVFLYQAARVRQRILEGYRKEGYYWTDVDIVSRGGDKDDKDQADVIFQIHEGPKVRVHDVVITGNKSMPDRGFWFWKDGISAYSKRDLDGPWLFNWKGSAFSEEILDADLLAMRNVYRDRGWLDAVVEAKLDFSTERDKVTIRVMIDEGERYHVSSLAIKGFEWANPNSRDEESLTPEDLVIPESELLALCDAQPGAVWEETRKVHDRFKLRDRYGRTGRISHPSLSRLVNWEFLDPELVFDHDAHSVAVTYRVVQGRPIRIHEIRFAGTRHTRDKVLRAELSVYPGQIANLEEIQKSLSRIEGTGYFSDTMHPEDHHDPTYRFRSVEGEPDNWDLEYVVEEGRVVDFNITGGVDSNDGLFGLVSLSMHNFDLSDTPSAPYRVFSEVYDKDAFHGAGQRLDLEVSPGTLVQRYRIHFYEPDIFNLYQNQIGLDLDLQKRTRLYDTHDEQRLEIAARLRRRFTRDFSVGVGFRYATVDVSSLDTNGVPPELAAQDQNGVITMQGLVFDATLRKYDSVMNPRQGYQLRWNAGLNGGAFGGDVEFVQNEVAFDHYLPFGNPAEEVVSALHTSIDVGAEDELDTGHGDVPFTEHYFLGGTQSLRGFEFRGVGPIDPASHFALGGQTYLDGTFEYQFPIYSTTQLGTYKKIETLRATFFFDYGVLDTDSYALDLSHMRASIGFGVGLAYPLPITLNFGFPIRSEPGDLRRTFSFSLGLR